MISQLSVETFLDALASERATPGGGSVAALMGAMAAALVSMVGNLTLGKAKYRDVEADVKGVLTKAEGLRHELTGLIEDDVRAFQAVMQAYALARQTDEEREVRSRAIQAALKDATLVPLRCCRACRELIDLSAVVAAKGNRNVVSDAGVAVLAAYAGLRSAALNVFTNTGMIKDQSFVEETVGELNGLLAQAAKATESTYQAVRAELP